MKNKLSYILFTFLLVSFISCGDQTSQDTIKPEEENTTKEFSLKGYEELELSEWGFNLSLMIPNEERNGEPKVKLTERGALEIVVGTSFGIEIMYGEGDIELLKTDLKEDLVFSHEIIEEEENALIYTQYIPDAGVKKQNHFFYKAQIGQDIYEVKELLDGEYGEGVVKKMLAAAKTLKGIEMTPKKAI